MNCNPAELVAARTLHGVARMKDITTKLDTVHGGANGRAIIGGIKTAARKGGEWLNQIGGWAGGAAAIKEGYDWLTGSGNNTGGNQPAPSPSPSPSQAAE
jgi:hypothetical protein